MNRMNNKDILQLDEYKIHNYCQQYKYNYKMYQENKVAIIETNFDSWKITSDESIIKGITTQKIEVRHLNKSGNRSGKMQYHLQNYARDIDYVFTNIIGTHNNSKTTVDGIFNLKNLLEGLKVCKQA